MELKPIAFKDWILYFWVWLKLYRYNWEEVRHYDWRETIWEFTTRDLFTIVQEYVKYTESKTDMKEEVLNEEKS